MGPDRFGRTIRSFALASIKNKNIVNHSIAVRVINPEIDYRVKLFTCFDDHFFGTDILVGHRVVRSVVAPFVFQGYRTIDIEAGGKHSGRVFGEIVECASCAAIFVEPGFGQHVGEILACVFKSEFDVGIFNEDNDRSHFAGNRKRIVRQSQTRLSGFTRHQVPPAVGCLRDKLVERNSDRFFGFGSGFGITGADTGRYRQSRFAGPGVGEQTVFFIKHNAILGQGQMLVLVSGFLDAENGSVRLCNCPDISLGNHRFGRNDGRGHHGCEYDFF